MADNWTISGNYFESCNCEAACPCVFLSPPPTGDCTLMVGWHIDSGNMNGVDLSGLNVALAVHSPGHMIEVKWRIALYLDETATEQQAGALGQIFSGQAGGHFAVLGQHIGEVAGVSSVPIDYKAEGKSRSLKVGNVAEMDIEGIEGGGGAEVKINGNPLGIVPGEPMVGARSGKLSYHDYGMDWELSGKNGFFSPFTYTGP